MKAQWIFLICAIAFYLLVKLVEVIANKRKRKGSNYGRSSSDDSGTDDTGTSGQDA